MKIHLWGTDFRRSTGDFRRKLCLPVEQRAAKMRQLLALGFHDLVYLWTCNRIEFYTTAENHFVDLKPLWKKMLATLDLPEEAYYQGYHLEGKSALRHLVRVASSLESLVVGEPQILGQLKESVQWTKENHFPLDPSLDRMFQFAFEAAKRVRTETKIAEKPVSVASLGLRYFEECEPVLPAKKVVVVGRGPISQTVVQWFRKNRPQVPVHWVNRRRELIADLARGISPEVTTQSLGDFLRAPGSFSHLFTATSSLEPVFTKNFLNAIPQHALLFDFGEPHDVEKADCDCAKVIHLEDLAEEACRNGLDRAGAVKEAEALIEQVLKDYILARKQAPILKEFSRIEANIEQLLIETFRLIENDFPETLHTDLKKLAEKLVKKNFHHSREHLRLVLREMTVAEPRPPESPV